MKILFWVVLILFSIVHTKIVHYSSLAYFPLTYIGAYGIYSQRKQGIAWPTWIRLLLGFIGSLLGIIFIALPLIDRYKNKLIEQGYIKDPFAAANLQATAHWNGWEWLAGVAFLLGILCAVALLNRWKYGMPALLFTCIIGLEILSILYVPNVAPYTQGAAVSFYQSKKGDDCYIIPVGFKSYAHLFYFEKPTPDHPEHANQEWLLNGQADKPVYVVTKITKQTEVTARYPLLQKLYEQNGFVFYEVRE
ncbi:MAG: hypothetical protein R2795_26380 [Saprospiraceae bacterium]